MKEIQNNVLKVIGKLFDLNLLKIKPNTNLHKNLGISNTDKVRLIMNLEKEFHIDITDEEMEKFKEVKDINLFIMKYHKSHKDE